MASRIPNINEGTTHRPRRRKKSWMTNVTRNVGSLGRTPTLMKMMSHNSCRQLHAWLRQSRNRTRLRLHLSAATEAPLLLPLLLPPSTRMKTTSLMLTWHLSKPPLRRRRKRLASPRRNLSETSTCLPTSFHALPLSILVGAPSSLYGGRSTPRQCPLGSVASCLCEFVLTCAIMMTHRIPF